MPRFDPTTRRRLSGAAQRRLSARGTAAPASDCPTPAGPPASIPARALADVAPPPLSRGVAACEAWVQSVNLRAVQLATAGADAERVRLVRGCVRKIGQLKDKARRSEKATELRRIRTGVAVDLLSDGPPLEDPIPACAWSFLRLCLVLHRICTEPDLQPLRYRDLVETIAASGFVPCKGAVDDLTRQLRSPPR